MPIDLVLLPCRADNYAVLLCDGERSGVAVVDTPDGAAIEAELDRRGWHLTDILTTHHHGDHTEGHARLKRRFGARVIAPVAEADRVPGTDLAVAEGAPLRVLDREVRVIATPGHTKGHLAYYFPEEALLFAGDTLFAMGCGRLFEDGPEAMWASLEKLARLPPETRVYCGHEYTLANARFALSVLPDDPAIRARAAEVEALRAQGLPTLPTTIALERATNPFLRAGEPAIQAAVGMKGAEARRVFAHFRALKDAFR